MRGDVGLREHAEDSSSVRIRGHSRRGRMSTAHSFVAAAILFDITSVASSVILTSSSSDDTTLCPYKIKSMALEAYLTQMSGRQIQGRRVPYFRRVSSMVVSLDAKLMRSSRVTISKDGW